MMGHMSQPVVFVRLFSTRLLYANGTPSIYFGMKLGWPSVQKLIYKETGSMVYKSLNSLAPQYLSDLFVRLSGVHPRELRNSKTDLAIPMFRTGNGQRSFAYRGASLWNSLDLETKMAPSINAFKSKLKGK